MVRFLFLLVFALQLLDAKELRIQAAFMQADYKHAKTLFEGSVRIQKGQDEINASRVILQGDANKKAKSITAEGNVSFRVADRGGVLYSGRAQKIIYLPPKREYRFYGDVYLVQDGGEREIRGDAIIFNAQKGSFLAKGDGSSAVAVILDLNETQK